MSKSAPYVNMHYIPFRYTLRYIILQYTAVGVPTVDRRHTVDFSRLHRVPVPGRCSTAGGGPFSPCLPNDVWCTKMYSSIYYTLLRNKWQKKKRKRKIAPVRRCSAKHSQSTACSGSLTANLLVQYTDTNQETRSNVIAAYPGLVVNVSSLQAQWCDVIDRCDGAHRTAKCQVSFLVGYFSSSALSSLPPRAYP